MMPEETGITAITGGRLIDGTGADPIENATVIVEGSSIRAVGKRLEIPRGARVLDVPGKTVMPGLINSHMHLSGGSSGTGPSPYRPREVAMFKAASDARQCLAAGFTTVKDCGGRNAPFLKQAVREGVLTGLPRIVAACCLMSQTNGSLDRSPGAPGSRDARQNNEAEGLICDGVDECAKAVRYALRLGADFIKAFASGGFHQPDIASPSGVEFSLEELGAFVKTAAQVGKYVTVHSQNCQGSKNAVLAGVKTIDHASRSDDEVVALGKSRGAIFVSTLAYLRVMLDDRRPGRPPQGSFMLQHEWDSSVQAYRRMHDAGAVLAAGTDSFGDPRLGALEMELLVKHCGFSPMEAIVAATKNAGAACFMADRIGTVEAGKLADIIVVEGDPLAEIGLLQDVNKIKMVILEGTVCVDRGL